MLHIAAVTMENGVQNVPQALMGARATVDTADAAHVQLDVAAGDVAGYVRQGDDLVIHLRNGEVIVLSDYFDDGDQNVPSLETLNGAGDYVPVDFGTSAAVEGVLTPSVGVAAGAAAAAGAAGALGGLGMAGVAGLGALAVGGVVAVAGGSGNNNGGTGAHVAAPEVGQYGSDTVSGTGTPGDTVTVTNQTTGEVIGTGTVDPDGKWSVTLDPRPNDGDQVSVSEKDPDGNTSGTTDVTIGQSRPEAPEVGQFGPDGFSGTGTPGDTITVTNETTGQVIGETTVGADGTWSLTPDPRPGAGDKITVVESDPHGNDSQGSDVTIGENRPTAPEIGQFGPDGFSGTGTPGDTITVTNETTGQVIGETTVGADGTWSVTPDPRPGDGDHISVTETDASGNSSQGADVTIGENRPVAPEVTETGPDTFSGTGTPGDTVTVTDDTTGQDLGSATVGPDGTWSITPDPKPGKGDRVTVTQTDKNGNDSQGAGVTVGSSTADTTAPDAPVGLTLDPGSDTGSSDSDRVTKDTTPTIKGAAGSAEAGATVTVYDTDGTTVLGTAVAGDDGSWSVTAGTLNEGQHSLTAKAADAAGNVSTASGPLAVTIDTTAPAAAQVATANAGTVSGTAEASATVTIDYTGDGEADATAAADGDGKWSFDGLTLADGIEVKVWATDVAGNISEVATEAVDAKVPVARIVNATPTFHETHISGDANASGDAVMADIDGDGDLDIFAATGGSSAWGGQTNHLWINDGKGSFTKSPNLPADTDFSKGVAIGDVDGNGKLDIYVANYGGQNSLWIQHLDGTFEERHIYTDGGDSQSAVMFDADGDDDLDIYVVNFNNQQNHLWINDGKGNFTVKIDIPKDNHSSWDAAAGDIDKDGDMDLYVVNHSTPNQIWRNDGNDGSGLPTFTGIGIDGETTGGRQASIGDVSRDGRPDIFVADGSVQKLWIQQEGGTFANHPLGNNAVSDASDAVMADIDGDGNLDIYIVDLTRQNRILINEGGGAFRPTGITDDTGGWHAAIGDVDGDGHPDIYVTTYSSGQPTLWINDGIAISAGTEVDVKSTEKGTVYLVNDKVTVNTLSDITNAPDNLQNAVEITDETQAVALDTSGLDGNGDTYHAYAVDLDGNLSPISEMNLIIT
ncbi:Ig-like domain-containing protein [Pelagibacterium halotolerans]|uniref:Ig-like domain-containing protein n=1 Tax=Pelagibacterium halotolerans TaxID=531813 RepID=UPI00384AF8CD